MVTCQKLSNFCPKFSIESKTRLLITEVNRINYQDIVWYELLGIQKKIILLKVNSQKYLPWN